MSVTAFSNSNIYNFPPKLNSIKSVKAMVCANIYKITPTSTVANVNDLKSFKKTNKRLDQLNDIQTEQYNWIRDVFVDYFHQLERIITTYGEIYQIHPKTLERTNHIDQKIKSHIQKTTFTHMTQSQVYAYAKMFADLNSKLPDMSNFPNEQVRQWVYDLQLSLPLAIKAMQDIGFWEMAKTKGYDINSNGLPKENFDLPQQYQDGMNMLETYLTKLIDYNQQFNDEFNYWTNSEIPSDLALKIKTKNKTNPNSDLNSNSNRDKIKNISTQFIIDLVLYLQNYQYIAESMIKNGNFETTDVSRLQWVGRNILKTFPDPAILVEKLKQISPLLDEHTRSIYVTYISVELPNVIRLIHRINRENKKPNLTTINSDRGKK